MSVPTAAGDAETARKLQELAAQASPAEHVKDVGGWRLRHTDGHSWWTGTVQPHADAGPPELARRIAEAEEFYAGHGVSARFQITPGACPETLDTVLAERGYRRERTVSLRVAPTARVLASVPEDGTRRAAVDDRPSQAWLEASQAVNGGDIGSEREVLGRVDVPSAYASAFSGDRVVAVGRAVADAGWAGVFGMATLPEARGKGAARTVLAALAGWAEAQRAERMYLQVVSDNLPAIRLYERAGFTELCGYHYRAAVPS